MHETTIVRIAIFEDDEEQLNFVNELAEKIAHSLNMQLDVFSAASLSEAQSPPENIFERECDIAIIDQNLAQSSSGLEVIAEHSKRGNFYKRPIYIFNSGEIDYHDNITLNKLLDLGLFKCVSKSDKGALETALTDAFNVVQSEILSQMLAAIPGAKLRKLLIDAEKTSSDIAERVSWDDLKNGRLTDAAILLCDLSNSTNLILNLRQGGSDPNSLELIPRIYENFLSLAADEIYKEGGIIDKFIGDRVMAYFPCIQGVSPKDACEAAVRAAKKINSKCVDLRDNLLAEMDITLMNEGVDIQPRTVLHFGRVIWKAVGRHGNFLDVSIYNEIVVMAVALLRHFDDNRRIISPGEIWLTNSIKRNLTDTSLQELAQEKDVQLPQFSRIRISEVCCIASKIKTQNLRLSISAGSKALGFHITYKRDQSGKIPTLVEELVSYAKSNYVNLVWDEGALKDQTDIRAFGKNFKNAICVSWFVSKHYFNSAICLIELFSALSSSDSCKIFPIFGDDYSFTNYKTDFDSGKIEKTIAKTLDIEFKKTFDGPSSLAWKNTLTEAKTRLIPMLRELNSHAQNGSLDFEKVAENVIRNYAALLSDRKLQTSIF